MATLEKKLKHLDLIQAVIARMANNSFLVKGWSVTLVSALIALAASNQGDRRYLLVALVPIAMFWFLDAYFLRQERLYRALYDKVRTLDEAAIDFALNPAAFVASTASELQTAFSRTLLPFHGMLAVVVLVAFFAL